MKVNCDYFKDRRAARKLKREENELRWKQERERDEIVRMKRWERVFKWYVYLGPNDCRFFEYVERKWVKDFSYYSKRHDDWLKVTGWVYRAETGDLDARFPDGSDSIQL